MSLRPDAWTPGASFPVQREMISGPDLGAGYLHQLTRDRAGGRVAFTFHAQAGGEDASGPPKGPLGPLGWTFPEEMCPLGGRACWHRRFELVESETGLVRATYQRTRLVLAAMLDALYGGAPPAIGPALEEVLDRFASDPAGPLPTWGITGELAERPTGGDRPVGSIEILTDVEGVRRIAEVLRDYLIEPPATTMWGARRLVAARAFVGSPASGARVGWSADPAGAVVVAREIARGARRVPIAAPPTFAAERVDR